jgi:hypothetical protein
MRLAARAALSILLLAPFPAAAMIGGAPAPAEIAAQAAMIVSTRGAACTGAVLARDLLLTAGHCVQPKADYAVAVFESAGPRLIPVARVALHPRFSTQAFRTRRPTPDLALVKLAAPLPAGFHPAKLARHVAPPLPGDEFLLAGYGVLAEGDDRSAGKLRVVSLPAIGNTIDSTGIIMVRLSRGGGRTAGACTGDSGGPAFREGLVAAIVGWSTGAGNRECGLVTGATLVAPQIDWIEETARELGAAPAN